MRRTGAPESSNVELGEAEELGLGLGLMRREAAAVTEETHNRCEWVWQTD